LYVRQKNKIAPGEGLSQLVLWLCGVLSFVKVINIIIGLNKKYSQLKKLPVK
jgi:hypothetical protein